MSIESHTDLEGVTEAGRVTTETLDALARHVRPGVTTAELDDVAAAVLARNGARSAPAMVYGFPGTVLISVNDEIVHGIPGSRPAISSAWTSRWRKTATLPTRRAA
jgi:methionyl aminopeptidase